MDDDDDVMCNLRAEKVRRLNLAHKKQVEDEWSEPFMSGVLDTEETTKMLEEFNLSLCSQYENSGIEEIMARNAEEEEAPREDECGASTGSDDSDWDEDYESGSGEEDEEDESEEADEDTPVKRTNLAPPVSAAGLKRQEKHRANFNSFTCPCSCKAKFDTSVLEKFFKVACGQTLQEKSIMLQHMFTQSVSVEKEVQRGKKRSSSGGEIARMPRSKVKYHLHGKEICKAAFLCFYAVGNTQVKGAKKKVSNQNYATYNKGTHVHKRRRRAQIAVKFLRRYAKRAGNPCPDGRGRNRDKFAYKLPIKHQKREVYKSYKSFVESDPTLGKPLGLNNFRSRVWAKKCPEIKVCGRKTDYCDVCVELMRRKYHDQRKAHLEDAKRERCYLRKAVEDAQSVEKEEPNQRSVIHISWDWAEPIRLPSFVLQPGRSYYYSGPWCGLYGVCNSITGVQDIYVCQEGFFPDKKNSVDINLSLIYDYFQRNKILEYKAKVRLHADNCRDQNKSRWHCMFFMWLVAVFDIEILEMHFCLPGHTKMRNDGLFGVFKRILSRLECYTHQHVYDAINDSTSSNNAVNCNKVKWYHWKDFLEQFFKHKGNHAHPKDLTVVRLFEYRSKDVGKTFYKYNSWDTSWNTYNGFLRGAAFTSEQLKNPDKNGLKKLDHEDFIMKLKPLSKDRKEHITKNFINPYYIEDLARHVPSIFEKWTVPEAAAAARIPSA